MSLMNAINVISPYKYNGMWVFDDPRVGLAQEPFVAGADTMIDRVVADIPNAEKGFTLIFSASPFPGHQHRLDWQRWMPREIGITPKNSKWKVGFALRCSCTSKRRRNTCMFRSRHGAKGRNCSPVLYGSPRNSGSNINCSHAGVSLIESLIITLLILFDNS